MRGISGRISRREALGLTVFTVVGLMLGTPARGEAEEPPAWEALGPTEEQVVQVFTPTSGALLVRTKQSLYRSDDGGVTWAIVQQPVDTDLITVSPVDHQQLYAAGPGGVFRSQDGGTNWEWISDQGGDWTWLRVSPADPSTLYGVAITHPPAPSGKNYWTEFRVSHDAGTTWGTTRTVRETFLGGTQPCAYAVQLVQPHSLNAARVLTVEGCSGRGSTPNGEMSVDAWQTKRQFPGGDVVNWGINGIDGGRGVRPERWYAAVDFPAEAYSRFVRSKILRSDDDGASWSTVYESDGGDPDHGKGVTTDWVAYIACDPQHPDDLYALFAHLETPPSQTGAHQLTGLAVKWSRDAGATWTELTASKLPVSRWYTELTVGVDGRYLYAATVKGLFRLAIPQ